MALILFLTFVAIDLMLNIFDLPFSLSFTIHDYNSFKVSFFTVVTNFINFFESMYKIVIANL